MERIRRSVKIIGQCLHPGNLMAHNWCSTKEAGFYVYEVRCDLDTHQEEDSSKTSTKSIFLNLNRLKLIIVKLQANQTSWKFFVPTEGQLHVFYLPFEQLSLSLEILRYFVLNTNFSWWLSPEESLFCRVRSPDCNGKKWSRWRWQAKNRD